MESNIIVNNSKSYSVIDNTIFKITAEESVKMILEDTQKLGLTVTIINATGISHTLSCKSFSDSSSYKIQPNAFIKIGWNGEKWVNITAQGVGSFMIQFPNMEHPEDIYPCTKWIEQHYAGAFFRADGGNALNFGTSVKVSSISDKILTVTETKNLKQGSLVYSPELNETRIVSELSGNTITLNNIFSKTITYIMIGQEDKNKAHFHDISHIHTFSGTTSTDGKHTHNYSRVSYNSRGAGDYWRASNHYETVDTSEAGEHTHTFSGTTTSANSSVSSSSGDIEARPNNFSIKIWKRIA